MFTVSLLLSLLQSITSLSFHGVFLNKLEINFVLRFGLQTNSLSSLVLKINREKIGRFKLLGFCSAETENVPRKKLDRNTWSSCQCRFLFYAFRCSSFQRDKIVMSFEAGTEVIGRECNHYQEGRNTGGAEGSYLCNRRQDVAS